jgi:hypothetical protein
MHSSETKTTDSSNELLCPGGRCEPGSLLLGVVGHDGAVGYIRPPLDLDEVFLDRARAGRNPRARFRFAESCTMGACAHWSGEGCGLVEGIVNSPTDCDRSDGLPRCGIRPRCRWHAEQGRDACFACRFVVTEID